MLKISQGRTGGVEREERGGEAWSVYFFFLHVAGIVFDLKSKQSLLNEFMGSGVESERGGVGSAGEREKLDLRFYYF